MTLLHHTADIFRGRGAYIEDEWLSDGGGPFAFRCRWDGEKYVVAALGDSYETEDPVSFRVEVAEAAASEDRLIVIRLRDRFFIFEATRALARGKVGKPLDADRPDDEEWVYVDPAVGCRFEDYVDGNDVPAGLE